MIRKLYLVFFLITSIMPLVSAREYFLIGDTSTLHKDIDVSFIPNNKKLLSLLLKQISTSQNHDSPLSFEFNNTSYEIILFDKASSDKLNQQFPKSDLKLDDVKLIEPVRNFMASSYKIMNLSCNDCEKLGHKNLKLYLTIDNKPKQIWISGTLKKGIKTLKVTRNIPAFSTINPSDISESIHYTDTPELYFNSSNELNIYKTNKSLLSGSMLKVNDLSYANLIKSGTIVDIFIKTKSIQIRTKGKALQNGKHNQFIRIQKLNSNKILSGQVKGENLVEVKL